MTLTLEDAKLAHPLAAAVLEQLGDDEDAIQQAIDAGEHGAGAGWPGFTYYSDTTAFFKANRAAIAKLAQGMADDLGEDVVEMVRHFRCLCTRSGGKSVPDYSALEVAAALTGGQADHDALDIISNTLAWFALEEVGRALTNG